MAENVGHLPHAAVSTTPPVKELSQSTTDNIELRLVTIS